MSRCNVLDVKVQGKFTPLSPTISYYLNDIRGVEVLTSDEEVELFSRIRLGDKEAKDRLILSNQRFVFAVAKRYAKSEDVLLDIVNEGNIGLMRAIEGFDPTLGFKFISYAVWYIRLEIGNYLKNHSVIIKQSNLNKTFKIIHKIRNKFFVQNGFYPSPNELIDILNNEYNLNIKNECDIYNLSISSIDNNIDTDHENTQGFKLLNDYESYTKNTNDCLEVEKKEHDLYIISNILKQLTAIERFIIEHSYGINGNDSATLQDISIKLGYTEERIRQIRKIALGKMKKFNPHDEIAI